MQEQIYLCFALVDEHGEIIRNERDDAFEQVPALSTVEGMRCVPVEVVVRERGSGE